MPKSKVKGGGTKKVCLPAAKARSLSKAEKQKIIRAKESAGRSGKYKRSSKTNVKGARKKGATLRDWFEKENWINSGHKTKSHIVKACSGGKEKIIRFGQQGVTTAGKPKKNESAKQKARRKSFKARHAKNIAKGKMSAAYWADKVKW